MHHKADSKNLMTMNVRPYHWATVILLCSLMAHAVDEKDQCEKKLVPAEAQKTQLTAFRGDRLERIRDSFRNLFNSIKNVTTSAPVEMGSSMKAESSPISPEEIGETLAPGEASADEAFYVSVNKTPVRYFRGAFYQHHDFFKGYSSSLDVLTAEQRELEPGIATATLRIQNRRPGRGFTLLIPSGFRPLPTKQQPQKIQVWVTASGEYKVKSLNAGPLEIAITELLPTALSAEELRIYSTADNIVELNAWPEPFGSNLRRFLTKLKADTALKSVQKAKIVAAWLRSQFTYTYAGAPGSNALEVTQAQRLQCTWAASLWVSILRSYLGLPARVAVGFRGEGHTSHPTHSFIFQTKVGHAWGEVYDFESQTWVTVDPTPGAVSAGESAPQEPEHSEGSFKYPGETTDGNSAPGGFAFQTQQASDEVETLPSWVAKELQGPKDSIGPPMSFDIPPGQLRTNRFTLAALEATWVALLRENWQAPQLSASKILQFLSFLDGRADKSRSQYGDRRDAVVYEKIYHEVLDYWLRSSLLQSPPLETREPSTSFSSLYGMLQTLLTIRSHTPWTKNESALFATIMGILKQNPMVPPSPTQRIDQIKAIYYRSLPGSITKDISEHIIAEEYKNDFMAALRDPDSKLPLKELGLTNIIKRVQLKRPTPVYTETTPLNQTLARISDQEMTQGPVVSIADWPRFIGQGASPEVMMFRAAIDNIEQRLFLEQSRRTRIKFVAPTELIVISLNTAPASDLINLQRAALDHALSKSLEAGNVAMVVAVKEDGLHWAYNYTEIRDVYDDMKVNSDSLNFDDMNRICDHIRLRPEITKVRIITGDADVERVLRGFQSTLKNPEIEVYVNQIAFDQSYDSQGKITVSHADGTSRLELNSRMLKASGTYWKLQKSGHDLTHALESVGNIIPLSDVIDLTPEQEENLENIILGLRRQNSASFPAGIPAPTQWLQFKNAVGLIKENLDKPQSWVHRRRRPSIEVKEALNEYVKVSSFATMALNPGRINESLFVFFEILSTKILGIPLSGLPWLLPDGEIQYLSQALYEPKPKP